MSKEITVRAPAKINLTLDVTGVRADGYHNLRMIMQSISLCDVVRIRRADGNRITCVMYGKTAPKDLLPEDNLAFRAAMLLRDEFTETGRFAAVLDKRKQSKGSGVSGSAGIFGNTGDTERNFPLISDFSGSTEKTEKNTALKSAQFNGIYGLSGGLAIEIEKNIPAAAGLAGGSADCAAVLWGICKLCDLPLSLDDLCALGVTLGADVPFCLRQGTALAEGIGERLSPLPALPKTFVLLIKPDFSLRTADVYRDFDRAGAVTHPDTEAAIDAIGRKDVASLCRYLENVLAVPAAGRYPKILSLIEFLRENGAVGANMSGSGPTVYGLFQDPIFAHMAEKKARGAFPEAEVILCETEGGFS